MLHSSTANRGTKPRSAMIIQYRAADNVQLSPDSPTQPGYGMLVRGEARTGPACSTARSSTSRRRSRTRPSATAEDRPDPRRSKRRCRPAIAPPARSHRNGFRMSPSPLDSQNAGPCRLGVGSRGSRQQIRSHPNEGGRTLRGRRPRRSTGRIIRRWFRRPAPARRSASAACRTGSRRHARSTPQRRSATFPDSCSSRAPARAAMHAGRTLSRTRSPSWSRRRPVPIRSPSPDGWSPGSTGRLSFRPTRRRSLAASSVFSATTSARPSSVFPRSREADQDLPVLRLALHDWVVAWDRRTGHAWIGGRALDGDGRRLARRLDDVHARLTIPQYRATTAGADGRDRAFAIHARTWTARRTRTVSREIRDHIARGDLYQANLTRRLEAPFDGDPWQLYRHLRTGDPSLFSAYLDLGPGQLSGRPRALLSASPEPFLSVDTNGVVEDRPDQGHPPPRPRRGHRPRARARAAGERQGQGGERDDRRRPPQRPRSCLPAR